MTFQGQSEADLSLPVPPMQKNLVAGCFHDALLLYATVLNETLREGGTKRDSSRILQKMKGRKFQGTGSWGGGEAAGRDMGGPCRAEPLGYPGLRFTKSGRNLRGWEWAGWRKGEGSVPGPQSLARREPSPAASCLPCVCGSWCQKWPHRNGGFSPPLPPPRPL